MTKKFINWSGKVSLAKVILISVVIVMVVVAVAFLKFLTPGASLMFLSLLDKATNHKLTESLNNAQSGLKNQTGAPGASVSHLSSENYLIKQTSELPISLSAPQGFFDAKATIRYITVGYAMSKAPAGSYGWQTDWKVIIDSNTTDMGTKSEIASPSGLSSSALTSDFSGSSMQTVMYFSLAGKKAGDKVPIRYTIKTTKEATYHFNEKDWIFYGKGNEPFAVVNVNTGERSANVESPPADAKNLDAILVKDDGEKGVILGFPPQDMTASQKSELEEINSYINSQQDVGGLKGFWQTQVYPKFSNIPQQPPLHIILKSDLPPGGYVKENIENAEYWNSAPGINVKNTSKNNSVNPNDANGDGIPNLVPLPGYNP